MLFFDWPLLQNFYLCKKKKSPLCILIKKTIAEKGTMASGTPSFIYYQQ